MRTVIVRTPVSDNYKLQIPDTPADLTAGPFHVLTGNSFGPVLAADLSEWKVMNGGTLGGNLRAGAYDATKSLWTPGLPGVWTVSILLAAQHSVAATLNALFGIKRADGTPTSNIGMLTNHTFNGTVTLQLNTYFNVLTKTDQFYLYFKRQVAGADVLLQAQAFAYPIGPTK